MKDDNKSSVLSYALPYPDDLLMPNFSSNSLEIMSKRHLLRDKDGNILETPSQMLWRVASSIAKEDTKYVKGTPDRKLRASEKSAREFYAMMAKSQFLPGSRVLYEAGNNIDGTKQLASCFVLPIEDDLSKIFQTMQEAAVVQKNNGGTGFNFSHIRPHGDTVGGTPNVAAGPVHFIKTYSQAFDQILQGKKRGGGNMAILNISHPDIVEFINLKGTNSNIRNFNLSVGITDEFMEAVKNDTDFDLINPRTGGSVKKIRAKDLFDLICQKAWECADPGIFFLDTAQSANPNKNLSVIEATNPCGEEPLRAYESCNLGSIALQNVLKMKAGKYAIDWDTLADLVAKAVHFLDNMIDLSQFPIEKIADQVHLTRKVGLGIMGWGATLYSLEIPYDSEEAISLAQKLVKFIKEKAVEESQLLAKERGAFPAFKGSDWDKKDIRVRNATVLSIAPTGTISLLVDTSSGIEPFFSLVYKFTNFYQDDGKEDQKKLLHVNKEFEQYAKRKGFYTDGLMEKIQEKGGSLHEIENIPDEAYRIFVTTHDIKPEWHIRMQAAFQDGVDAAVSKTINLANSATVDDVKSAYILAWELKCKGTTIYRDGSKENQVLETVAKKDEQVKQVTNFTPINSERKFKSANLPQHALEVLSKRALKKDGNGNVVETTEELWKRIADFVSSKEDKDIRGTISENFFNLMHSGYFYCGGALLWAGMGKDNILSKCLVLPLSDSIDSIFQTLEWNIQCLRRGVGTGFNFSAIRSSYSKVSTTGENAAGPILYLKTYNAAQETIRGRGGRELGAMAILNADHPNIEDFISIKDDDQSLKHYNISIGASDKFMKAVKNSADWDFVDPHDQKVYKTVKARELFESIAKHAWKSGDPGMFFLDTAEKGNTTPTLGNMNATNPCGEQPLIPFETCNMGHINLSKLVKGFPLIDIDNFEALSLEEKFGYIDWDILKFVIKNGVRFLDDIIDTNNYPIPEIENMTKKTRNIGLGVMGFADMLIKLGVIYGSQDSLDLIEKVMGFIQDSAHKASEELGEEKGNFPAFEDSTWAKSGQKYMRNTRVTTIAPTGTISIIANCNPGIEPIFALGYKRKNSMGGTVQDVTDPLIDQVAKKKGFYSKEFIDKISNGDHLKDIAVQFNVPSNLVEIFKTTHEIDPEDHIKIQAEFQKNIDSAVSKTINMPNSATWEDIARAYMLAYDLGCKGITVFRDGSKDSALEVGTSTSAKSSSVNSFSAEKQPAINAGPIKVMIEPQRNSLEPRKRATITRGYTYEVKTEQGDLYITINEDDKGICEVFLNLGKSGSFTAGYTEALGRLISMSLRSGVKPDLIIKQLQGIRTSSPTLNKGMIIYSVPDAVAKILKKHVEEMAQQIKLIPDTILAAVSDSLNEVSADEEPVLVNTELKISETIEATAQSTAESSTSTYSKHNAYGGLLECPDCGGDLEYSEGCILCRACGYSKCG